MRYGSRYPPRGRGGGRGVFAGRDRPQQYMPDDYECHTVVMDPGCYCECCGKKHALSFKYVQRQWMCNCKDCTGGGGQAGFGKCGNVRKHGAKYIAGFIDKISCRVHDTHVHNVFMYKSQSGLRCTCRFCIYCRNDKEGCKNVELLVAKYDEPKALLSEL